MKDAFVPGLLGAIVSVVLCAFFYLLLVFLMSGGLPAEGTHGGSLIAMLAKVFTVLIIWPGVLVFCVIFADGYFMAGFSRELLLRGLKRGALVSVSYGVLIPLLTNALKMAGLQPHALRVPFFVLLYLVLPAGVLWYMAKRGG